MMKQNQATARGKWTQKRWIIVIIILTVVVVGSWWHWNKNQGEQTVVEPVKADNRVLATGIVVPVKYAQMTMPEYSTISEILAVEGDHVKVGQPIIRLVQEDYQSRVESTRLDAVRSTAAVEQCKVNLAEAEQELGRQQRMAASGATARQLIDQAKSAVERNRAILAQTQATLEAGQERTSESERLLGKRELRAPFDGIVEFLDAKAGESYSTGAVLVRIADPSAWEVRSDDLTELVVSKVQVGDQVTLTFDGIPSLEIPGKVKFIRKYGEKKRGDITYTVVITPERWDEHLCWMMTAQIAITPTR